MSKDNFESLVSEGKAILAEGAGIQDLSNIGEEFPLVERNKLAEGVNSAYHSWYAKSISALPVALQAEFEKHYSGKFLTPGTSAFLGNPLEISPFWDNATMKPFLTSPFQHEFNKSMRVPMMAQISILERMVHVKPGVLQLPDGEIRLPSNLVGYVSHLQAFLEVNKYENNVFVMMKYRAKNEQLKKAISLGIERNGKKAVLASDFSITDELSNVIACLLCCKYGIALFDDPEDGQHINPNVAYELGIMHFLGRPCLILKSDQLSSLQSDILAKLYTSYSPSQPLDIVDKIGAWLKGK